MSGSEVKEAKLSVSDFDQKIKIFQSLILPDLTPLPNEVNTSGRPISFAMQLEILQAADEKGQKDITTICRTDTKVFNILYLNALKVLFIHRSGVLGANMLNDVRTKSAG